MNEEIPKQEGVASVDSFVDYGTHPPFVQITAGGELYVYGLTKDGCVWSFNRLDGEWKELLQM